MTIHRVRSTKFLGIHIDYELEWGDHIEHIAKKAASGSYAIRSAKRFLSVDNLKSLYFSLVHSYLAYGNMIWGTAYLHRLHRIIMIQKKCVRNVCNVPYNVETSCLFKQVGIPKCVDIMPIQVCKFMYAYTNGHLPEKYICEEYRNT